MWRQFPIHVSPRLCPLDMQILSIRIWNRWWLDVEKWRRRLWSRERNFGHVQASEVVDSWVSGKLPRTIPRLDDQSNQSFCKPKDMTRLFTTSGIELSSLTPPEPGVASIFLQTQASSPPWEKKFLRSFSLFSGFSSQNLRHLLFLQRCRLSVFIPPYPFRHALHPRSKQWLIFRRC
jgi:hypothetical protein